MVRHLIIALVVSLAVGCSSIIDDFVQLPGDGPSTDSAQDTSSQEDGGNPEQ